SLLSAEGLENPVAVLFGSDSEVLIRTQGAMQDGAVVKLNRELGSLGAEITSVERAPRTKDGFTQQLVIDQASPEQLEKSGLFTPEVYGQVAYEVEEGNTLVFIEQ